MDKISFYHSGYKPYIITDMIFELYFNTIIFNNNNNNNKKIKKNNH